MNCSCKEANVNELIIWEGERSIHLPSESNSIVFSQGKRFFRDSFESGFCVKFCLEGEERYFVNNKEYLNRKGQFLVNNDRAEVSIDFEGKTISKGLCVYLSRDVVQDAHQTLYKGVFDSKTLVNDIPLFFEDVNETHFSNLGKVLPGISYAITSNNADYDLDFLYFEIAEALLRDRLQVERSFDRISRLKKSTREEIYRKILIAKNYIHSSCNKPFSLDDLARESGISKFQLIRVFQSYMGLTPKQYDLRVRMEKARDLLTSNYFDSVSAVAFHLGYSDLPTFSKAFKRVIGHSPNLLINNQSII